MVWVWHWAGSWPGGCECLGVCETFAVYLPTAWSTVSIPFSVGRRRWFANALLWVHTAPRVWGGGGGSRVMGITPARCNGGKRGPKGREGKESCLCFAFLPALPTYTHNLQVKLIACCQAAGKYRGRLAGWLILFQGCGQVPMATIKGTGVDSSLIWGFGAVRLESVLLYPMYLPPNSTT